MTEEEKIEAAFIAGYRRGFDDADYSDGSSFAVRGAYLDWKEIQDA